MPLGVRGRPQRRPDIVGARGDEDIRKQPGIEPAPIPLAVESTASADQQRPLFPDQRPDGLEKRVKNPVRHQARQPLCRPGLHPAVVDVEMAEIGFVQKRHTLRIGEHPIQQDALVARRRDLCLERRQCHQFSGIAQPDLAASEPKRRVGKTVGKGIADTRPDHHPGKTLNAERGVNRVERPNVPLPDQRVARLALWKGRQRIGPQQVRALVGRAQDFDRLPEQRALRQTRRLQPHVPGANRAPQGIDAGRPATDDDRLG